MLKRYKFIKIDPDYIVHTMLIKLALMILKIKQDSTSTIVG